MIHHISNRVSNGRLSHRSEIINFIGKLIRATSYLEIGVGNGHTFQQVDIPQKLAVDPNPGIELPEMKPVTSNDFFQSNFQIFDVIFIDGQHTYEQSAIDTKESLKILSDWGVVVLHDCNPTTEEMASKEMVANLWCGEVWKTFVTLRAQKHLNCICLDTDFGVGLLTCNPNTNPLVLPKPIEKLTYRDFDNNRNRWLRLNPPEIRVVMKFLK